MYQYNPLYKINITRYNLILDVVTRLDLSYLWASGGQKWEMDTVCKNNKELSHKYYIHWKRVYNKVEDMVQNNLMFDEAHSILTTDPVLVLVQQYNHHLDRSKKDMKYLQKRALYYYNLEKEKKNQ